MAYLTPSPKMQFFTANGAPLVGGKLYTYQAGTTTPLATYVDQAGSSSNPNPVIMDSRGEANVWLANSVLYDFVLKDSADVLIWTSTNVGDAGSDPLASTFKVQNFSGDGTTVAFVLAYEPPNENNTQIYINGAYQQKNTYSLAASTITFSSPPPLGTNNIEVMTIATLSFGYIDSSLVNYIPPGTGAVSTTVQTELNRTIFADNFPTIQQAIDATAAGGELIFSDQVYSFSSTLNITRSITLKGKAGRQDYDNSWDLAGGTVLHYTGTTGDAVSVNAGITGNVRLRFIARDILIRGAKVSPGAATTGSGLHIEANSATTSVHTYFDNVSVCECAEHGIFMEGAIYGVSSNALSCFDNGKNGLRVAGGADPIGETTWIQTRLFANGASGTAETACGLFFQGGGRSNSFIGLSCSENIGYGAIVRGSVSGMGWQFESNQGAIQLYFGSAGGGSGLTSANISELTFAPGAGYTGKIIHVTSDAGNVVLNGVFFGDTLGIGGEDARVDGGKFAISGVSGTHTFTPVVTTNDAFIEGAVPYTNKLLPAFNSKVSADILNITGDGTGYTVVFDQDIFDNSSSHSTATGVFTAPHAGLYLFTYVVSLGGILAGHTQGLIQLTLTSNSITYRIAPTQVADVLGTAAFTGSHLVQMAQNDTCGVYVQVDNATKAVDVIGGGFSWFSGHMVAGA